MNYERFEQKLAEYRLIDDDFMSVFFDGQNEIMEFILKIILQKSLTVTETKTQIEIDCMATFKDNILFGECKWTNDLVDEKILNELQKKAQNFDYKDKYYYLFSKSGFNQNIIKKSKQDSNLKLITLEEVYNF